MQIRSITYFCNPGFPVRDITLQKAGIFIRHARQVFENAGYTVQTQRLTTPPFPLWLNPGQAVFGAQSLQLAAHGEGFDYVSIGPALTDDLDSYSLIAPILQETKNIFVSAMTTTPASEVSLPAARACAEIIEKISEYETGGFANLRFAALANVPASAPFFPAAYHQGSKPAFALAIEAADLVVEAFSKARTLSDARKGMIAEIEKHAAVLEEVGRSLEKIYQFSFKGLDFTPAPYPQPERSIGLAMERLGVPAVGMQGSLAAAAFITDSLDRANYTRCGFNGLMLPVLEDSTLALRASEGLLSINDLLLFSTVCGTGLDVIPLPGDTNADQLNAILLDLSVLALRLDKPLTARLMPIPGKKAGEPTDFNFEYFSNTKVMPIKAQALTSPLNGNESLQISCRNKA